MSTTSPEPEPTPDVDLSEHDDDMPILPNPYGDDDAAQDKETP